ncbi:MAG: O-antigen ligase family protein [Akkermansiaceae bacterium]
MLKVRVFFLIVALLIFLFSGVDLAYQKIGFGLLAVGVVLTLYPWVTNRKDWSIGLTELGSLGLAGAYFLGRGLLSDTPGFAFADRVLFLSFVGVYLATRLLGARGGRGLVYGIIFLGAVNAGLGFVQYWNPGMDYLFRQGAVPEWGMTGLFGHYNYFAAFSNMALILAASMVVSPRSSRATRTGMAILAFVLVVAIYLSGSRGGWLAFLIGFGAFACLYAFRLYQDKNKAFSLVLGFMVVGLVFGGITLKQKFNHVLEQRSRDNSEAMEDGGRLVFQQWAFDFFLDEPLIGNGPRSFEYLSLARWDQDDLGYWFPDPDFAHNEFLQILCDYGVIGFSLLMIVLFVAGVRGLARLLSTDERKGLTGRELLPGVIAALIALLAQSLFSFLAHAPTFIGAMAIFMALMYGSCRSRARFPILSKAAVSAMGLGAVTLGLMLVSAFHAQKKGQVMLAGAASLDQKITALEAIQNAALISHDSLLAERVGLAAHNLNREAEQNAKKEEAEQLRQEAFEAFELARKLNPHSLVALCAQARILDESGEYERAFEFHREAAEAAWSREFFLRPNFEAAKNRAALGLRQFKQGNQKKAEEHFRAALDFLLRRVELMNGYDRDKDAQGMRKRLTGWVAFYEAQRLYREGDRRWKERDAGSGLALMLEARERYRISQKVVSRHEPLWKPQWKQLNENIKILEGAGITPSEISAEEAERIAKGLESPSPKR